MKVRQRAIFELIRLALMPGRLLAFVCACAVLLATRCIQSGDRQIIWSLSAPARRLSDKARGLVDDRASCWRIFRNIRANSHRDMSESEIILPESCPQAPLWREFRASSSVEFIIGSKDRPQQLRNALRGLATFIHPSENTRATILILATNELYASAYTHLQTRYEEHLFIWRGVDSYFDDVRRAVQESTATNFVIMSDDTLFFRPCDIRSFASLQNMLEQDSLRTKISVQLRASSRDVRPPSIAHFLPKEGLPYAHLINCTRGLWNTFYSSCYDRQIDGAMFTRATLQGELQNLKAFAIPGHPGELEGLWMNWAEMASWIDLTIIPVDRVVMNVGLALGTVRADRESLEKNLTHNALTRDQAARDILQGCFWEVARMDEYFQVDQTAGSFDLQRRCYDES